MKSSLQDSGLLSIPFPITDYNTGKPQCQKLKLTNQIQSRLKTSAGMITYVFVLAPRLHLYIAQWFPNQGMLPPTVGCIFPYQLTILHCCVISSYLIPLLEESSMKTFVNFWLFSVSLNMSSCSRDHSLMMYLTCIFS